MSIRSGEKRTLFYFIVGIVDDFEGMINSLENAVGFDWVFYALAKSFLLALYLKALQMMWKSIATQIQLLEKQGNCVFCKSAILGG